MSDSDKPEHLPICPHDDCTSWVGKLPTKPFNEK